MANYKISAYYDEDRQETRYTLSTHDYEMDILDLATGSELLDVILSVTDGELDVNIDPTLTREIYNRG